jgi:hypothetical protein
MEWQELLHRRLPITNCADGSHTHKIGLPADRGNELGATIAHDETWPSRSRRGARHPHARSRPGGRRVRARDQRSFKADVVLLAVVRGQARLVYEAALAGRARPPPRPAG